MRNLVPIFVVIGMFVFVLLGNLLFYFVGFGLLFAYNKHLVFSALGFTLLITAITIQWYFLVNAFWAKCAMAEGVGFQDGRSKIYLTNLELIGKTVKVGSVLEEQKKRVRATIT